MNQFTKIIERRKQDEGEMKEMAKSCSNCVHRKSKYEFGDSGRITFFCYCCMMDGRNKFTPTDHPIEKGGEQK